MIPVPTPLLLARRFGRSGAIAGLVLALAMTGCTRDEPTVDTTANSGTDATPAPEAGPVEAIVRTESGDFRFELRPDVAPLACANFVNLVQRGFYDGLEFYRHSRVIRQTGNPLNDESQRWDCGYRFMPEFSPDLRFDRGGMVALTRLVDDVASPVRPNEFFVTTKPQSERFTFTYPIFGVVVDGQDVVNAMPEGTVIRTIELVGDPSSLLAAYADAVAIWNEALDRAIDPRQTSP